MLWRNILKISQPHTQAPNWSRASSPAPTVTGGLPSLPSITAPDLLAVLSSEGTDSPADSPMNLESLRFIGRKAVDFLVATHVFTSQPGCSVDVLRTRYAKVTIESLAVYYPTYDADKLLSYVGAVYLQDGFQTVDTWLRALLAHREDHNLSGKRPREEDEAELEAKETSKIRRESIAGTAADTPEGFISLSDANLPASSGFGAIPSAGDSTALVAAPAIANPDVKKWMSVMNEGLHKNRLRAQWTYASSGQAHELTWTATLSIPHHATPVHTMGTRSTKHAAKEEAAMRACQKLGWKY